MPPNPERNCNVSLFLGETGLIYPPAPRLFPLQHPLLSFCWARETIIFVAKQADMLVLFSPPHFAWYDTECDYIYEHAWGSDGFLYGRNRPFDRDSFCEWVKCYNFRDRCWIKRPSKDLTFPDVFR